MDIKCLLEELKEDISKNQFRGICYVDTWDYEGEYSHNEIENVRHDFVRLANKYFKEEKLPYIMKELCDNAIVCDLSGNILE